MKSNLVENLREILGERGEINLSRSPIGVDNKVYFARCESHGIFVVKCYTKKSLAGVVKIYQFHQALEGRGIPVPEMVQFPSLINNKPTLVAKYVQGVHLGKLSEKPLREVANAMADIHALKFASGNDRHEKESFKFKKFIELCSDFKGISALSEIYHRIDRSQFSLLPKGYIHGDFSCSNILWRHGKIVALLDEDHCREDFLLVDITRAMIFFGFPGGLFDSSAVNSFVRGYNAQRKLLEAEKACFYDLLRLNFIKMILETHFYVYVTEEIPCEIFEKSQYNMSPNDLFARFVQIADINKLDI